MTSSTSRRIRLLILVVTLFATLTGCVVAPLAGPYRQTQLPYESGPPGPYVDAGPPAAQYEVIPLAPALGHIWISGFWNWHLGRHAWVGGRWAMPPQGRYWVPHRWERGHQGWRQQPGHWGRR